LLAALGSRQSALFRGAGATEADRIVIEADPDAQMSA